jgi:hypothetical protein
MSVEQCRTVVMDRRGSCGSCEIPIQRAASGAIRLIDYSPGAGSVLTAIIDPIDWAGITAWKARRVDLRSYLEGEAVSDD